MEDKALMINLKAWAKNTIRIIVLIGLLHIASASENSISELKHQISSFDDPLITVEDLAFYLVTHSYDARPKEGYAELKLNGSIYKLIPNGSKQGLCDILLADESNK